MIKISEIEVREFRGLRNLRLDFSGSNFAICGPNGTGKSGVVDALEFALTGNISRLSGEGSGNVSVKVHGPHVDFRDEPQKASVRLRFSVPSKNIDGSIERNVKASSNPAISPNSADTKNVVSYLERHPEVVLSRRELIKFILAPPNKRAEQVQALLHLDQIGQVRSGLQRIANEAKKQVLHFEGSVGSALTQLLSSVGLEKYEETDFVSIINEKRIVLGLQPILALNSDTSLKEGLLVSQEPTNRVSKMQANSDIVQFEKQFALLQSAKVKNLVASLQGALELLLSDPEQATAAARKEFYASGLDFVQSEACPFCDVEWPLDDLRKLISEKMLRLEKLSESRVKMAMKALEIAKLCQDLVLSAESLLGHFKSSEVLQKLSWLSKLSEEFSDAEVEFREFKDLRKISELFSLLMGFPEVSIAFQLESLKEYIALLPDQSTQTLARDALNIADERFKFWKQAELQLTQGRDAELLSRTISETYNTTSDSFLADVYRSVEFEFARLYAYVNNDDESEFSATLKPSAGSLSFNVNFYNKGSFPPSAYHSEGHQDSMGICLYLALMKFLHREQFTLAILDDVLMSVDAAHRRIICALLKAEFPNTQFILTTHDKNWLHHMKSEKLIGSNASVYFRRWSVDTGPDYFEGRDVWSEIDSHLTRSDVRAAAGALRHYLEYVATEACNRLRAPVAYRADAQYQLGEMLPAAIKRMKRLLKVAKKAASSWDNRDLVERIANEESELTSAVEASGVETWQINTIVHFNEWENLGASEFLRVVHAYSALLQQLSCSKCKVFLRIVPEREAPDSLRCDCGSISYNLVVKT